MSTTDTAGIARRVTPLLDGYFPDGMPFRLVLWDGSSIGPSDAPVVHVRSRDAVRHLLWHPNEIGLARAYIGGDLDTELPLDEVLTVAWQAVGQRRPERLPWARMIGTAARLGLLRPPPPRPPEEAHPRGRLHSPRRDRAAIRHHYDAGNDFYELVLDETMAYSCGYWHGIDPASDGTAASRAKLDLICRDLDLAPGKHLVDVGCGWGSLVRYAAAHFGTRVSGFTLSAEQAAFTARAIERDGLDEVATVAVRDYRDVEFAGMDAVAAIEIGEHVGEKQYPRFARKLHDMLAPGGRLVLQQMSRPAGSAPGGGPFIERYIAPDMHMGPLEHTVERLEDAGFTIVTVRDLREHYVHTIEAWARRLELRWSQVVELVGERNARIWRIYLAGGKQAFAEHRMGVEQIVAIR